MSPFDSKQRWYDDPERRTDLDVASATRTTTTTLPPFICDGIDTLNARHNVTAISGAGATVTVSLETSFDGTNWTQVAAFPARTATGADVKTFAGLGSQ